MDKKYKKIVVLLVVVAAMLAFFGLGWQQYFSLGHIKSQQEAFALFYQENQVLTLAIYAAVYIGVAALSLPGAAILTLLGGALFGFWVGLVVVSFASTIGATCAFLVSRYLVGDYLQKKYSDRFKAINEGVKKEGVYYLFAMRLIPVIPFFLINILMGLTKIPVVKFFVVSQIGMLPGTAVYIFAGKQIANIDSLAGILKPEVIAAFVLLGLFPIVVKKVLGKG